MVDTSSTASRGRQPSAITGALRTTIFGLTPGGNISWLK